MKNIGLGGSHERGHDDEEEDEGRSVSVVRRHLRLLGVLEAVSAGAEEDVEARVEAEERVDVALEATKCLIKVLPGLII